MRHSHWAAAVLVLLAAVPCRAWMRFPYEDGEVVRRSDLIVVGSAMNGTLRYVPHATDANDGFSWEHQFTLHISAIIKGEAGPVDVPITLNYGIEPSDGKPAAHSRAGRTLATTQAVVIFDHAGGWSETIVPDAMRENVWLLRRGDDGRYHVADPEEVRPLDHREYLTCYLAADPEAAVRAQLQRQPAIAIPATRYLAHLRVERCLKESNLAIRAELLLPYFLSRQTWSGRWEAQEAMATCGADAGPYLLGAYQSTSDQPLREQIIALWGGTRYQGATDILVKLLDDRSHFWSGQHLERGWWNDHRDPQLRKRRRDAYGDVWQAVLALQQIGDSRARPAIEAARSQWALIAFENPQIVQACDAALATLARQVKGPTPPASASPAGT